MRQPEAASRLFARPIVPVVVQQHAEEAALLRQVRSVLVRAPHVDLIRLARLDERIDAHLDGLVVAGDAGLRQCRAALERPGTGEVFALGVLAVERDDMALIDSLLALWPSVPEARPGLVSALAWVPALKLQHVVPRLLGSPPGPALELGIEVCRLHQIDPGAVLPQALASSDPGVQATAARAAGDLGRIDLVPALLTGVADAPEALAFWRARSACLLGDRGQALASLARTALGEGPWSAQALPVAMAAARPEQAQAWAQQISSAARAPDAGLGALRRLVRVIALLGDLRMVPWLIARMADPLLARWAGEAFHWVTGADLALLDLETLDAPGEQVPKDDGEETLDADDDLPWPDPARLEAWWAGARGALEAVTPDGRLFMGQAMNLHTARQVLATGTQRQRAHAAVMIALMQPGRPLFQVAAPARRQRLALSGRAG